jgi:type IV secretory pathway VirB6-like protein
MWGMLAGGAFGGSSYESSVEGGPFASPFVNNAGFSLFGSNPVFDSGATSSQPYTNTATSSASNNMMTYALIAGAIVIVYILAKK